MGKSSLVLRFVKGQFHEYQESTIGGECQLQEVLTLLGQSGVSEMRLAILVWIFAINRVKQLML